MKKIYLRPVLSVKVVKHINYLCAASILRQTSSSAEWGDQGEYAPDEWINERHSETTGWPSVGIEEDTKDLWSR